MSRQLHLLRAVTRPRRAIPGQGLLDPSVTRMRVRPGDLDMYLLFTRGDELIARALVAGRFLSKSGGRIPAPDVAALMGAEPESPTLPDDVAAWARAVGVAHREG
jgi:hypothetical protein